MPLTSWFVNSSFRSFFEIRASRQLKELYLFSLLFSFAFALITIFEPVFFYQQGFSLAKIALYYALHYTLYVLVMPFGAKFAARFGLERSLALSTPMFVLYFVALALIPEYPSFFWVALILLTTHKIFYWPAYHADFAKFSDGKNRGTELSWLTLIIYGTGILGPLLGGVIAAKFGFPVLFVFTGCTVLIAGIPMLRTTERFKITSFPYASAWRILRAKQHRGMAVAMLGMGEELVHLIIWPIFLFIALDSVEQLGFVTSFAVAVMTVWGFIVGELSDRAPKSNSLQRSVPWLVGGNISRVLAITFLPALIIDTFVRIATVKVRTPMLMKLYGEAKRVGPLRYSVAFETALAVAKAVTAWIFVGIFLATTPATGFIIVFWIGAVLAILYGFL